MPPFTFALQQARQSRRERRSDALLGEYQARNEQKDHLFRLVIQVVAFSFATYSAIAGYVLTRGENEHIDAILYWLLPLTFVIPYSLCVILFITMIFLGYYLRDLEILIRQETGVSLFNYQLAETRALWSIRTGSWGFLGAYGIIFAIAAVLYFALTLLSYRGLLDLEDTGVLFHTWQRWLFLGSQAAVVVGFMAVFVVSQTRIYDLYQRWIPVRNDDRASGGLGLLRYAILPRPFDLILKGVITVSAAIVFAQLTRATLSGELVTYVIVAVVVLELIAKQTTYLINDVRGYAEDAAHPHKSHWRLSRFASWQTGARIALVRLGVTAAVTLLVLAIPDLRWLALLVVITLLWQGAYEVSKRWPAIRLAVAALGYSERVAAGALAVMAARGQLEWDLLIVGCAWGSTYAVAFLAAYWRAEHAEPLRQPNSWFARRGTLIAALANVALVVVGSALVLIGRPGATDTEVTALTIGGGIAILFIISAYRFATLTTRVGWMFAALGLAASSLILRDLSLLFLPVGISALVASLSARASFDEVTLVAFGATARSLQQGALLLLFGRPPEERTPTTSG